MLTLLFGQDQSQINCVAASKTQFLSNSFYAI